MNTRQKGRKLVKWLVDYFRPFDPHVVEIVGSGAGREKGDMRIPRANLVIEAKNQETLHIGRDILQAKRQGFNVNEYALIFRHPQSPQDNPDCYAVIHVDYLSTLLQKAYGERMITDDNKELRYMLRQARENMRRILKYLGE